MSKESLIRKLGEVTDNVEKTKMVYQQLLGQQSLLKGLIKEAMEAENKDVAEVEEVEEEKEEEKK